MNTDKHRYSFRKILAAVLLSALWCAAPVRAQDPSPYGSGHGGAGGGNGQSLPEVIEAIEKARVTTRILYVTAHPDDEPGAVLAYLARGLHADVALLSLTRGEGGQNALGPEQAPQLGVIRTEELMRATQVYGTRLFFTRAPDFGYTKPPEEAMKVWGDLVLEDMVRVIRTFRPHVIINNWGGVRTGHGHHQASGILTPKAYAMAADADAFPEQIKEGLQPWKAEALLQLSRGEASGGFAIPVSEISALWGKSWGEIGIEGYLNHRTQGVGGVRSSPYFRRPIALVAVEGAKPDAALLSAPLDSLKNRYPESAEVLKPLLKKVNDELQRAREAAMKFDFRAATTALGNAGNELDIFGRVPYKGAEQSGDAVFSDLSELKERVEAALCATAALRVEVRAERGEFVANERLPVRVEVHHRPEISVETFSPGLVSPWERSEFKATSADTFQGYVMVTVPAQENLRRGDWIYPFPGAGFSLDIAMIIENYKLRTLYPGTSLRVTSTSADERQVQMVPAVTLTVEPRRFVVVSGGNLKSEIGDLKSEKQERSFVPIKPIGTQDDKKRQGGVPSAAVPSAAVPSAALGTGRAGEPPHFKTGDLPVAPTRQDTKQTTKRITEQTVEFVGAGDQLVRFAVKPPVEMTALRPGSGQAGKYELKAYARRESGEAQSQAMQGEEFRTSLEPLVTLPTRLWREPAVAKVHVMDVAVPKDLRVGYVAAENDPIPQALREIGVHVELLDEAQLAFGDLSKYDAIAIGIRAYELRSDLARANQRLLDYAAAGGTLVVQYQREGVWNQLKPAPYPATIGNGLRTTDENSPVRVPDPAHPVLNFPNAIRAEDFSGWVQERGLYYWDKFDGKYTAVLALKDPGEEEELGALVTARHGKGVYIYTGLSFFRQLPEGVAGAYRLFVNLLSQGKKKRE